MFEDNKITIDKIKTILYAVRCEFENEIDDIDNIFDKELTDEEINFAFEFLDRYIDRTEMTIDDEVED